ncbi:MAG TPA: quinone-dependent dihydroorotate dehydrogenase [Chitinophagaceae bacterium]|jgi:dihydroorotate dehydrogenase|nr:quinone-dependent dihydroorotate dehydrogenase [Chitinophagaceae bacterium]
MYPLLRRLLFLLPAETAHYVSMNALKAACSVPFIRHTVGRTFDPGPGLPAAFCGIDFPNPVGLGAGFDKNARYLPELQALGFGFIEIGTVTPRPQAGNPKPRLFRLPADKALINRMGFNNDGVEVVRERLKRWREKEAESHELRAAGKENNRRSSIRKDTSPEDHRTPYTVHRTAADTRFIIGGNIGKNKDTPNEEAWKDYEQCFLELHPYVDFFVVNVSSPNTPGLRALQEKDALQRILTHLQDLNAGFEVPKPILLKIAPDLTTEQIDDVIDLAREINLDGLVATNTTIERTGLRTDPGTVKGIGAGGLSGKPVEARSSDVVRYIHSRTGGRLPLIGSGGIFTGADAEEKMAAGATLVEVWTGFVYEGPRIVRNICRHLRKKLIPAGSSR